MKHKIVVAVSGASGSIYARLLLQRLTEIPEQIANVGVVFSSSAKQVWEHELQNRDFEKLPFSVWENTNFYAPFASGSAGFNTMIVCPCSMGMLGRIAGGISDDLITRAADVILKERRKLILCLRETPYNLVHIRNMETITLAGGIVCPATPSYYSRPESIEEVALTVVDRVLDLAGFRIVSKRWQNNE
jgi:4-hydroxy-3-polyprenylbenzoate decarboxylase